MARQKEADTGLALRRLKAALRTGEVDRLYFFYGEESFLREYYTAQLKKKLLSGPAAEFNLHEFTASELTPQLLSEAVDAVPMMAERTLILVDDVDLFKQPEAQRAQYTQILSGLPDYCCVCFTYDTVEFRLNGTMKKLAECLRAHAQLVEFARQSERDLVSWIIRHFQAQGKSISDELCRYLIFLTDGLMTTLAGEISKIAAYSQGAQITRGDLDAVVIPALNAQTFDISDAIASGRYELALRKLRELYAMQTEPLAILGAIGAQLRRMLYARLILASGGSQQDFMELTGLRSYPAGLAISAARRVSDGFCRRAAELCLQTDYDVKTGAQEPKAALELLIVQLAQEARNG